MGEINPTGDSASFLDLDKYRMLEESGFDWDAEMMKAEEERDPVIREQKIDDLNDMIQRESNTLGRRTMRSWTSLNEWANKTNPVKKSNLMGDLTGLVKVANKLDSVGLQKEADLIDSYIRDLLDKKLKDYTYNWSVGWNDDGEESFHSESDAEK